MSTEELFPVEAGAAESPRLRWQRKHAIRFHHAEHLEHNPQEMPWCAWLPENDNESSSDGAKWGGVPRDPEKCGYGRTETDAAMDLARVTGIRLWNEEQP